MRHFTEKGIRVARRIPERCWGCGRPESFHVLSCLAAFSKEAREGSKKVDGSLQRARATDETNGAVIASASAPAA